MIDVTEPGTGQALPMDTGFMVFNEETYPHLCRLFRTLEVAWKNAPMSFAGRHDPTGIEWCGYSLNHLFAQRRNLLSPRFWRLLLHNQSLQQARPHGLANTRSGNNFPA